MLEFSVVSNLVLTRNQKNTLHKLVEFAHEKEGVEDLIAFVGASQHHVTNHICTSFASENIDRSAARRSTARLKQAGEGAETHATACCHDMIRE